MILIMPDTPSENGPAHKIPSTLAIFPSITIAGINKITCLKKDSAVDGNAFPTDWKKIHITRLEPIIKQAHKYVRTHLTAYSI